MSNQGGKGEMGREVGREIREREEGEWGGRGGQGGREMWG